MTLEEAIKHTEEKAEELRNDAEHYEIAVVNVYGCEECAKEHEQLAEWLRDYKRLKEQEPCEDAVSRQAVIDGLASIAMVKAKSDAQKSLMGRSIFFTEHLPSVNPQPKIGHWIEDKEQIHVERTYHCSECGCMAFGNERSNYRPDCGAEMAENNEG